MDAARGHWGAYEHAVPADHLDLTAEVRRWSRIGTAGQIALKPVGSES
ncbi:MAG: WGR domain-containing protein [Actinomycetota bacterium]|nr:WGR domain-containing protein [Actinomycetota bacterium]